MVTRIVSGKSIRGALKYNENKVESGEASLLLASGFATEVETLSTEQKYRRFENLTMMNERAKTNALHISLNFAQEDKLDAAQFGQIASAFMERIGFGEQPYLVYLHTDAAHPHLHVVTTNIRPDGGRIDTHNIGRTLALDARRELENEFGLVKAEGRNTSDEVNIKAADPEKARYGEQYTKRAITNITGAVMRTYKFSSFSEYNAVLRAFNVTADRGGEQTDIYRKGGLLYSLLNRHGEKIGVPIKASAVYGKPILANLEKRFERNRELRKPFKENIRERIDRVLQERSVVDRASLIAELQKTGITAVFHQNKDNIVYGLTLVDHRTKAVFKGSDLGKAYTAKALSERLKFPEQKQQPGNKLRSGLKKPTGLKAKPGAQRYVKAPESSEYLKLALGRDKSGAPVAPSITKPKRRKKKQTVIHF